MRPSSLWSSSLTDFKRVPQTAPANTDRAIRPYAAALHKKGNLRGTHRGRIMYFVGEFVLMLIYLSLGGKVLVATLVRALATAALVGWMLPYRKHVCPSYIYVYPPVALQSLWKLKARVITRFSGFRWTRHLGFICFLLLVLVVNFYYWLTC